LTDLDGLGMKKVVGKFTAKQLGATYFHGSKPIDGIWATGNLAVANACVMPVGFRVKDHQLFVIDFATTMLVVRPTSTYGAIRIAHSLVRSKSHQKQACEQNRTLAGAIKIAPRVLNLQVRTYLMTGRIPAKATKHLKSLLVTRYLIGNKKREARR
jgi:hypothetical protein